MTINEAIKYLSNVNKKWGAWKTHHRKLTKAIDTLVNVAICSKFNYVDTDSIRQYTANILDNKPVTIIMGERGSGKKHYMNMHKLKDLFDDFFALANHLLTHGITIQESDQQ